MTLVKVSPMTDTWHLLATNLYYTKRGDTAYLSFENYAQEAGTGYQLVGTLPEGYRPKRTQFFSLGTPGNSTATCPQVARVHATGEVQVAFYVARNVFDTVSFPT